MNLPVGWGLSVYGLHVRLVAAGVSFLSPKTCFSGLLMIRTWMCRCVFCLRWTDDLPRMQPTFCPPTSILANLINKSVVNFSTNTFIKVNQNSSILLPFNLTSTFKLETVEYFIN